MKQFKEIFLIVLTIIFLMVGYSFATNDNIYGTFWKKIGSILEPADDITGVGFGGKSFLYETIPNWDTAVADVHLTTGIDDHDGDGS